MDNSNKLYNLSIEFAVRIVKLNSYLRRNHDEYTLSKQLLRAGTSIGANIAESKGCQSKADFIAKLHISLKEARESEYWLILLFKSSYITNKEYTTIKSDLDYIISLLVITLKKLKDSDN